MWRVQLWWGDRDDDGRPIESSGEWEYGTTYYSRRDAERAAEERRAEGWAVRVVRV